MQTNYTLDTVGKFCPAPIIETANKLKEMKDGETLMIISDYTEIKNDMRNWCAMTGNKFLGELDEDDEIKVFIRKVIV